jgi:hypothetical protein
MQSPKIPANDSTNGLKTNLANNHNPTFVVVLLMKQGLLYPRFIWLEGSLVLIFRPYISPADFDRIYQTPASP